MICLQRRQGWEVTFQRAHAMMAAQILSHWQRDEQVGFWPKLLAATAQHDNGWTEWEPGGRLSDAGAPMDFRHAPKLSILSQAQHVCQMGWHQDRVVGWLISRHMAELYEAIHLNDEDFGPWLKDQRKRRADAVCGLDIEAQELEAGYRLLLWADTLSLTLCKEQMPFGGRTVALGADHHGRAYQAWLEEAEDVVRIWPWPFEASSVRVEVESYALSSLTFEHHDALLATIEETTPIIRRFELAAASGPQIVGQDWSELTVAQLRTRAAQSKIEGRSSMTKAQLVDALKAKHGGVS